MQFLMFSEQTDALVDSSMIFYNSNQQEDTSVAVGWNGWTSRIKDFLDTYENKTGKVCDQDNKAGKDETCVFQVSFLVLKGFMGVLYY